MRSTLIVVLGLCSLAACTWPPRLPSAPAAPNPADTAGQAVGAVPVAVPNVAAPQVPVPRVAPPVMSAPRVGGGGGLLSR